MAPATRSINTPELSAPITSLPVAGSTIIFAGTLVAANAAGYAVPAADVDGLTVIGRAEADCDNRSGAAGDLTVIVAQGIFKYATPADEAKVTIADTGKVVYVLDDQTVGKTSTKSVAAGRVIRVDGDGIYIDTAHRTE